MNTFTDALPHALARVRTLFETARSRIIIISAFVGSETLRCLLDAVPRGVEATVYARWSFEDLASGATDWNAWDVAKLYLAKLYACPDLHAKMYIADNKALVGSANATRSGFGQSGRPNLELLLPVDAQQEDIVEVLAAVRRMSSLAMPVGADILGHGADIDQSGSAPNVPSIWMPTCDPDLLLDVVKGIGSQTEESLADCHALQLSEGDNRKKIRIAVSEKTVFRIVKDKLDQWPGPLNSGHLRRLLLEENFLPFNELPDENLKLLMKWMGRFGENMHLVPGSKDVPDTLYPGPVIASFSEKV